MRVFLITGFGLDKRAFAPLHLPSEPYHLVDLIPVRKGETLRDYALRLAREIGLTPDDIIGGVSLGGMLALEMDKAIGTRGVLIIASAAHPRHIRKRFLNLAYITPWVPQFFIRKIFAMVPVVLHWQRMLTPEGQALLVDIMTKFPPELLQDLPPMIKRWPGCEPPARFRQIHSEGDWMIRPNGNPATLTLLKGKNHLLTVSHPEEIRKLVLETVELFQAMPTSAKASEGSLRK